MKLLQERVSSIFYYHGLFCASHPWTIITLAISIVFFTCYPLTTLPLPGNAPLTFTTPIHGYKVPLQENPSSASTQSTSSREEGKRPRWYVDAPVAYIQQIILRAAVSPWQPRRLIQTDAFRAPLSLVFDILEQVNNFQFQDGDKKLSVPDMCLHVSETKHVQHLHEILPEYKCLLISPASFWKQDRSRFIDDGELIQTIYKKRGQPLDAPPTVRDLLFGYPWKDTGMTRYFIRNRQRVLTYAITVVMKKYNLGFVSALRDKLHKLYPLSIPSNNSEINHLVHIHFKDVNYFVEYTPLIVAYIVLFLYLYFSVRKIEMVKSKWGLALSAVTTVVASLMMSVGLCTFFGLTPSLRGSEIFPYLVVIVGLENVLVVTKSVVSTPVHLDVKLRVAQGLSKEGWYIFKNLMVELFILAIGFFTFVPAIQEFCLFAVVGLCSDFFLQMVFFTTVLSIDIRRMELSDLHKQSVQQSMQETSPSTSLTTQPPFTCPVMTRIAGPPPMSSSKLARTNSAPMLHVNTVGHDQIPSPSPSPPCSPSSVQPDQFFPPHTFLKIPKRVRFLNFWAQTRVAQRIIMCCVVIWIALIVYKSGLVSHIRQSLTEDTTSHEPHAMSPTFEKLLGKDGYTSVNNGYEDTTGGAKHKDYTQGYKTVRVSQVSNIEREISVLEHDDMESWRRLSYMHWPTLLGYYNISLLGRYMTILPSVLLSASITPEEAIKMRHPLEAKAVSHLHTVADDYHIHLDDHVPKIPLPESKIELLFSMMLVAASVILISYFMTMLYKCMCSRNYAKWRSSWARKRSPKASPYYKQIRESLPLVLRGHAQEVECLVTDGPLIVSSCLEGQLRVWDSMSGECLTAIKRVSVDPTVERSPAVGRNISDSEAALYAEYHGSPPKANFISPLPKSQNTSAPNMRQSQTIKAQSQQRPHSADLADIIPDLTSTINTNFKNTTRTTTTNKGQLTSNLVPPGNSLNNASPDSDTTPKVNNAQSMSGGNGYDFSQFKSYFDEHHDMVAEREEIIRRRLSSRDGSTTSGHWQMGEGDGSLEEPVNERSRSWSYGDSPNSMSELCLDDSGLGQAAPPIWCIDCRDNLLAVGCSNGRIEFWDGLTGSLKCLYEESRVAVTAICFISNRVITARINGSVDFLELETFANISVPCTPGTTSGTNLHIRGHVRHPSNHSLNAQDLKSWDEVIRCNHVHSVRAHQQPINVLQSAGGRVVTASQDHTLKVFRLEDSLCLYTLHGHIAPVTCLELDKMAPLAASSGSEDGTVRIWDMLTGACVHKLCGHTGTVTTLTNTPKYVISIGMDDRLCVWERSRGDLLHWIQMEAGYCNTVAMLTSKLMVTGGQGCIYLWDVSKGEILRAVRLGDHDYSVFVRLVRVIGNSIVACDYGSELRVIHFPAVLEKAE